MSESANFNSIANNIYDKGAAFLIGAGVSESMGYPSSDILAERMADSFKKDSTGKGMKKSLEEVVKGILQTTNRKDLVEWIRSEFRNVMDGRDNNIFDNPYSYLAIISKEIIQKNSKEEKSTNLYFFTTNFDGELVKSFDKVLDRGKDFEVFVSNEDFYNRKNVPIHVYLLHGGLNFSQGGEDTLVLTNEDFENREKYNDAMYVDLQYAMQHFPLFIVGYSMKDTDIKRTYETVKQRIAVMETFEVNPAGSSMDGTTEIKIEQLPFLYGVASSLNKIYKTEIPLGKPQIVELSYYKDFARIVEESKKTNKSIVIYGNHYSGKTMFINNLYSINKFPEEYRYIPLCTFSESDKGREEAKDTIKTSTIAECTPYEKEWIFGDDGSTEKKSFLKSFNFISKRSAKEKESVAQVNNVHYLEAKLYYEDAEKLIDHYFEIYGYANDSSLTADRKKLLISLGSYLEPPAAKGQTNKGILIPPLLEKAVKNYANKTLEELKEIENKQRTNEKLIADMIGLSLLEGVGVGYDVTVEFLKKFKNTALSVLASTPGVPIIGVAILGIAGIMSFYNKKKNEGLDRFVKLLSYWDKMPVEERKILSEMLDRKSKLPPGSAYSFLSHWLSKGEENIDEKSSKLLKKLKNIFTDDFINKMMEVVNDYPDVVKAIKEHNKKIEEIENKI